MTRVVSVLAVAVAAIGTGCMGTTHASRSGAASAQTQPSPGQWAGQGQAQAPTGQGGMGMGMMAQCPMAVPGTQVAATDTPDGEAITFTTTSPDAVQELRNRVHAMADMHNQHHAGGQMGMSGETHGGAGSAGAGMQGDEHGSAGVGEKDAGTVHGDLQNEGHDTASGGDTNETGEGSAGSGQGSEVQGSGSTGSSDSGSMGGSAATGSETEHTHMMKHPSHAVVEDVDGGARVTVTPDDPADLQRLQTAVRSHVARMSQTGSCGMGERTMQQGQPQPAPQQ